MTIVGYDEVAVPPIYFVIAYISFDLLALCLILNAVRFVSKLFRKALPLYFTEMLQIIIINCYQWLSAVIINGYQL